MAVVFFTIFLVVPWQVAYLGCWVFQFYVSITSDESAASTSSASAIPLMSRMTDQPGSRNDDDWSDVYTASNNSQQIAEIKAVESGREKQSNEYLLLLMTWLLPLAAPVLAVWVRTLATAGLTTPFDGDHNFLYVAPFIVLLDLGPVAAGFLATRYVVFQI